MVVSLVGGLEAECGSVGGEDIAGLDYAAVGSKFAGENTGRLVAVGKWDVEAADLVGLELTSLVDDDWKFEWALDRDTEVRVSVID